MDGEEPMILNLGAAVNVVGAIRTHTAQAIGCPEWDAPGIRAALTGCEGTPGAVLAAACLAAEDAALAKPSVAALRNHWPINAKSEPPRTPQLDRCLVHPGQDRRTCRACADERGPELTPEQIAEQARALRAQVADQQRQVRELNAQRRAIQSGAIA